MNSYSICVTSYHFSAHPDALYVSPLFLFLFSTKARAIKQNCETAPTVTVHDNGTQIFFPAFLNVALSHFNDFVIRQLNRE